MSVLVPRPEALHVRGKNPPKMVESDVFNVCERIREIDPSLYVVWQEGQRKPFIVVEVCADGEHRMVERYEELDQRILEDLRRMLHIPYEKRFAAVAREVDEHNERQKGFDMSKHDTEKLAWTMRNSLTELDHGTKLTSFRPKKRS